MVNIIGADRFHHESDEEFESGYFTLKRLKAATQNFCPKNSWICSWGSWGRLYKGILPNGMNIAVTRMNITDKAAKSQLQIAVNTISTLRHPNVARLFGHCTLKNEDLLVYEYMENGSLDRALFGNENLKKRLSWDIIVQICLGIAKGLAFLHHKDQSKAMIIHRDIKPEHIYLDKFLNPKISDFTYAITFGEDDTHISTAVIGTIGYVDPQYLNTGTVSEKSDVYSFGVIILVLMCRQKPLTLSAIKALPLIAHDLHRNADLLSLIDEELKESVTTKDATMLLHLAILCTNHSRELRPTMSEVVNIIERKSITKIPPVDPQYFETNTFNYRYLEVATKNFSSANKIGQGSSGSVYKGMVPNGMMIAVKQLHNKPDQGKLEISNEVNIVSTLRHPNVVRLFGHCTENDHQSLVYEYMEKGCLNKALFGPINLKKKLTWPARVKICKGIANGLAFLHDNGSKMQIVHGDIKLSNILLDKDLNPKISDFGFIKHYNREITPSKTRLAGTVTVTEKIDVYSFGVVVLELMTGKNRVQWKTKHESASLLDSSSDSLQKGHLLQLIEQDLEMNIPEKGAKMILNSALACTHDNPEIRPIMSAVVSTLDLSIPINSAPPNVNYTRRFNHIEEAIDDISLCNLSSRRAILLSSNVLSVEEECKNDVELGHEFVSDGNILPNKATQNDMSLSQAIVATYEPPKLNDTPTFSVSEQAPIREHKTKLEYVEPSFEEGKLRIECSDEEFKAGCNEWKDSLVGFFVAEEGYLDADIKMVEELWEVKGNLSMFAMNNGFYLFKFSCTEDKIRVLESADLWQIQQRPLILREWNWKLNFDRVEMKFLPVWVKIHNLPLFLWTTSFLSKVGSGLGIPLHADRKTNNRERLAYAMLCIDVEAHTSLPESLNIIVKGMEYHMDIEYDLRTLKFANCSTFRQKNSKCRLKMKALMEI
ncbi:hypothetical protein MKX01_009545 [Papaver californicum]|nr:hypothetical protein MKX01_009545 [Papaver californicum]